MNVNLDKANVATVLVLVIAALGAAVVVLSAVDVVKDPQLRLGFRDYIEALTVAVAGLAVGRGIAASKNKEA